MKTPSSIYVRIGITLGSLAAYVVIFPILYPLGGLATTALTVVPTAMAGWFLGRRASVALGILNAPVNILLFRLVGDMADANNFAAAIFASFVLTITGILVAWVRGLMDQINKQSEELREERKILQEEMEKRIQAEERLIHEALHDPLTNLPNRRLFFNRLEHLMECNKRQPTDQFAVIYLDFDGFKTINDSLGHQAGDQILMAMAKRLKSATRAMDTVARMGGDEFAILLEVVKKDDEVL